MERNLTLITVTTGVVVAVTASILISKIERLTRLALDIKRSLHDLHDLVHELHSVNSQGNRSSVKKALEIVSESVCSTSSDLEYFDTDNVFENDLIFMDGGRVSLFYDKIDNIIEEFPLQAFHGLESGKHKLKNESEWLWRMSKAFRFRALKSRDADKKKAELFKAIDYGERAVKADNENPEAHKWYGISIGARAEYGTVSEKIRDGFKFKDEIDTALKLNPSDAHLHYLIGRFNYEVSCLTWIEQSAAAALYGSVPHATVDEALDELMEAEKLNEDSSCWLANRYLIGKCFVDKQNYKEAIKWFDEAAMCQVKSLEEEEIQKDLLALQTKYASYRIN